MNCILRKWRLSDAKELAAALNNEKIHRNLRDGLPYPYTERNAHDHIITMLSSDETCTFAYAITVNDRVVGSIAAFRQSNIHRQTAELGYYLAEEYWGRGIMTDAIQQLCDILFQTTDLLRVYAEPFACNTGSRRALEKAGFAFEGMMKNNAVKNGKVQNMALYSLTRTMEPYPGLSREAIPAALELCWRVFSEFEAPEYSAEGIAAFWASLDDQKRIRALDFYGAFDEDTLVGVLCMRAPQHIAGFFVDAAYHRRGIGKKLFTAMAQDYARQAFTVHSSPCAVEIYRHLGFVPTDTEQTVDGLRFIPMKYPADAKKDSGIPLTEIPCQ